MKHSRNNKYWIGCSSYGAVLTWKSRSLVNKQIGIQTFNDSPHHDIPIQWTLNTCKAPGVQCLEIHPCVYFPTDTALDNFDWLLSGNKHFIWYPKLFDTLIHRFFSGVKIIFYLSRNSNVKIWKNAMNFYFI